MSPERYIADVLRLKYGPAQTQGWSPRLRERFGYRSPDDWYEATVVGLVTPDTAWLDVGCGRQIFPANGAAARLLAARCRFLMGLDPSPNVLENPFVHDRAQCTLQEFRTERRFDLITLRMVAEHIEDPASAAAALARLTRPGGRVVIYTVWRYAPVSLVSAITPMRVHHALKRVLWRTEERDSFPVSYRMNTRSALRRLFARAGFAEESFRYLDDCRSLARWKSLHRAELTLWRALRGLGLHYPEVCLLGVYRKEPAAIGADH